MRKIIVRKIAEGKKALSNGAVRKLLRPPVSVSLCVAAIFFAVVSIFSINPFDLSFSPFGAGLLLAKDGDAGYGAVPIGKYTELGLRDGIHNNGQSALWDLDIVDYYKIFGPPQRARGYRPEQPIRFSHITHVQQNKMECQFCHYSVAKAPFAAIPEVETCIGCHKVVSSAALKSRSDAATDATEKERLASGAKEVEKLEGYWTRKEPIPWVKVHVQPNYVHFNHKRHVKGGVSCQECHGQVPNMQVVERASSMKMGWCLDCHRQRGASIDCYTCHH